MDVDFSETRMYCGSLFVPAAERTITFIPSFARSLPRFGVAGGFSGAVDAAGQTFRRAPTSDGMEVNGGGLTRGFDRTGRHH